jgi:hypothetical protein
MNITNLTHALLAVVCQLVVATGLWLVGIDFSTACAMGGLLAVGFYWGREVTQAEAKAGTPPWYSGFKIWEWSLDSKLDLLFPVIATVIVSVIIFII